MQYNMVEAKSQLSKLVQAAPLLKNWPMVTCLETLPARHPSALLVDDGSLRKTGCAVVPTLYHMLRNFCLSYAGSAGHHFLRLY